jgi:hypothetical protein
LTSVTLVYHFKKWMILGERLFVSC